MDTNTQRLIEAPSGADLQTRRYPRLRWSDRGAIQEIVAKKRLVIGASADADIVLTDDTVSRVHALIEPHENGIVIRDLDSTNGTFLDGARITEATVRRSAELRLGTTRLLIDFDSAVVTPVEVWREDFFQHLVGCSTVMRELFALLARVAPSDASVLIQAETGTGKEVVARSIHDASNRSAKPYVVVDCAALPENLLDSELFGHVKGSFTGASATRAGAIESANGGTVFLDEIGEVPLAMQPKLLRVLEQRTVRRIGESTHRAVDVRFVTATHRNLLQMVSRGQFREDLYFRLCVIPVTVPPLRDRKEDIKLLAHHFLRGTKNPFSDDFFERLVDMPWRGNVRELRNHIERARALGEDYATGFDPPSRRLERAPELMMRRDTVAPPGPASGDGAAARGAIPVARDIVVERERTASIDAAHFPSSLPPPARTPSFASLESGLPPPAPSVAAEASTDPALFLGSFKVFREKWLETGEREYLSRALERHSRSVAAIAQEADVDRTYIYRLMRKYGL